VEAALRIPECAEAVRKFKGDGEVCGHKVLDNGKAVEALLDAAPSHLQSSLRTGDVTLFRKTQLLDAVLRNHWVVDKRGKVDGTPSPRALLKQQKAAEREAAAEQPSGGADAPQS
jgi:hypothetical protein